MTPYVCHTFQKGLSIRALVSLSLSITAHLFSHLCIICMYMLVFDYVYNASSLYIPTCLQKTFFSLWYEFTESYIIISCSVFYLLPRFTGPSSGRFLLKSHLRASSRLCSPQGTDAYSQMIPAMYFIVFTEKIFSARAMARASFFSW